MNQPKLQTTKLTTYFKRYFLLICLSLFLFNCDTDETISMQEENLLESKFKIPSVSIAQNSFELSTQIRDPFKSASSSSSELFRTNSEIENEIIVNWDKSVAKNFKEEYGGVDILYTPVEYNSHNVRMKTFIASVENESELESSIITVVYDDTSNKYQFSGLIIKHYLNGDLKQIYRYENGIRVLESVEYDSYIEDNQSETTSIAIGDALFTEYPEADTDCSMTLYDLLMALWDSGGGYYAFDTVVVVVASNNNGTGSNGGTGESDGGWGWDGDGFDWENPDDILTEGGGGSSGGGENSDDGNNDNTDETSDEVEPEWWEDCGEGYVQDSDGNCVEIPCEGNPVSNPEVAPQLGVSGIKGALYGCTRYGGSCTSTDGRTKSHAGIDLKSSFGDPIYAMYSGLIFSTKYDSDGAGYYTRRQSTVNGETFLVEYYHLQEENRILQGNPLAYVNAGDIIGYQGNSGNLKDAIEGGTVESHVHIEVREHDGTTSWGYDNFNSVDPRSYLSTTIDDNGVSQSSTNCN